MDGHVEVHAKPHEMGRERIAVTPIPEARSAGGACGAVLDDLERIPRVDETECVGCNLCSLVCPVDQCITMVERDFGIGGGDVGRTDECGGGAGGVKRLNTDDTDGTDLRPTTD